LRASDIATALDVEVADVEASIRTLTAAGWVSSPASGLGVLVGDASTWLIHDAGGRADLSNPGLAASRLMTSMGAQVDDTVRDRAEITRWTNEHKDELVTALDVGTRVGDPAQAADLDAAIWRVAADVPDRQWWSALAKHGEHAAAKADNVDTLIALISASARALAMVNDRAGAEEQWQHALRLSLDLHDARRYDHLVTILTRVAAGWPEQALSARSLRRRDCSRLVVKTFVCAGSGVGVIPPVGGYQSDRFSPVEWVSGARSLIRGGWPGVFVEEAGGAIRCLLVGVIGSADGEPVARGWVGGNVVRPA
jgi:hypothetical protein